MSYRIAAAVLLLLLCPSITHAGQVSIAWDANEDGAATGYKVYISESSGTFGEGVDVGNVTTYTASGLQDARSYYFTITAYDADGVESDHSLEVSDFVPPAGIDITIALAPQDTTLNINATSYVADETLMTYTWPERKVANAILMKFDLSAIPAGALIQDATLQLSLVASDTAAGTYSISAHKVVGRSPIVTRATGYSADGVTGWTANACCHNNVPLAQSNISIAYDRRAVDSAPGGKTWAMTSLVREWMAEPATNNGLVLNSDNTVAANRFRYFASSEHRDIASRPQLHITYTPPPAAPPPAATTIRLTPEDTSLNINATNYSAQPTLMTYTWPERQVANAIAMKFDLSQIPAGALIEDATLYMSLIESDGSADTTYAIAAHRIVGRVPDIAKATGYTSDGATPWTTSACCYNAVPMAQANISSSYDQRAVDKRTEPKPWTITRLVQEWLSNPASNLGLLLNSDPAALANRYRYFASMEHPDPNLRPVLVIRYVR